MATALTTIFDGNPQILTPLAASLDPTGFDTATIRIDFRGQGVNSIPDQYKKGAPATGHPNMFCTGILSVDDARFGWITCTVGYKGFWGSAPADVVSFSLEGYDRMWPFENNGITYGFSGANLRPARAPLNTAGGVARPWRVRQSLERGSVSVEGVVIEDSGTIHTPPDKPPAGVAEPPIDRTLQNRNIQDPLLSTRIGWVRTSYKVSSFEQIGTKVLRQWAATFEWRDAVSE